MVGMQSMRQASEFIFDQFINRGYVPGLPFIKGTWYYVDPLNGSDSRSGKSVDKALLTFLAAYNKCTTWRGDGICVLEAGATTTTTSCTLDAVIDWTKYGITVFGVASPVGYFGRARITNTSTVLDLAYLINISGMNNRIYNIMMYNGGTDAAALGCLIISGNRNYIGGGHICGGNSASGPGDETGCNSLDLRASECRFDGVVFGTNSTIQAAANAPILFSTTAQGQNLFDRCRVISRSDTSGHGAIKISGAATMNGWTEFRDFTAQNFSAAGSGAQTALTTMVIGDAQNNCGLVFTGGLAHPGWAATSVLASKAYTTGPVSSTAGVAGLATIPAA